MDLNKVTWRKASRSTVQADSCVEVAALPERVAIRDSKDPDGPKLILTSREFRRFADAVKNA
jgi:hypothetical protein